MEDVQVYMLWLVEDRCRGLIVAFLLWADV